MVVRLGPLDPLVGRLKPRSGGAFPLERRETNPAARRYRVGLAGSFSAPLIARTVTGRHAHTSPNDLAPPRRGFFRWNAPSREGRSSTDGGRRPAPGPRQIMSAVAARPSRWMARTTYRGRSRNPDEISLRYAFRFSADIWSTFWSWSSNASSNAWTASSLKNRPPDICRHSSPVKLRLVLSLIANSPS